MSDQGRSLSSSSLAHSPSPSPLPAAASTPSLSPTSPTAAAIAAAAAATAAIALPASSAPHAAPPPPPPPRHARKTWALGVNPERLIGIPAGICSGATKLFVGHPFDTIKVRMQTEGSHGRFKGPLDCLLTTLRKEGFRALYKGATPPLIGWTLMDATQMFTLTNLRHIIKSLKHDPSAPLSVGEHALAGLGAGIVVSFVATPVELLKAKLQVQYDGEKVYKGPIDAARKLFRNHGVPGLYQGLAGCLMFRSFFWVLWGSYDVYSSQLKRWGMDAGTTAFLAGGLAANTFWTISYPCDVVKNRMMAQPDPGKNARRSDWRYPSVASCFRSIYATDGIKGFYRGFVPCFLRSFPTNGAAILVFETVSSAGRSLLKDY